VMTDRSVIAYPAILHFSESRHYIREVSPANTMAYDSTLILTGCIYQKWKGGETRLSSKARRGSCGKQGGEVF